MRAAVVRRSMGAASRKSALDSRKSKLNACARWVILHSVESNYDFIEPTTLTFTNLPGNPLFYLKNRISNSSTPQTVCISAGFTAFRWHWTVGPFPVDVAAVRQAAAEWIGVEGQGTCCLPSRPIQGTVSSAGAPPILAAKSHQAAAIVAEGTLRRSGEAARSAIGRRWKVSRAPEIPVAAHHLGRSVFGFGAAMPGVVHCDGCISNRNWTLCWRFRRGDELLFQRKVPLDPAWMVCSQSVSIAAWETRARRRHWSHNHAGT